MIETTRFILQILLILLIGIIITVFIIRTVLVIAFYRQQMREYPKTPRHKALLSALEKANP